MNSKDLHTHSSAPGGQHSPDASGTIEREVDMVQDGLAGVREAAKFLSLSRSTLYALMESGQLVYVKIGRARRIPRRALIELAAANVRGGWMREAG
ncbi:MAG: helix-turn-helix domain-containing protein [Candidatus Binatia bacterium]